MNDPWQKPLDEQLAELRLDVPPPRNLWPGIAARLERRPRRGRPMLFAAGHRRRPSWRRGLRRSMIGQMRATSPRTILSK
jgi:hypothetical protein